MRKIYFLLTIILATLLLSTSVFGLFNPLAYSAETANMAAQTIAQDWVNLLVALPALLISAVYAFKKSTKGLIVWLGCLIFLAYSFAIYAFDVHINNMFLAYVSILGLSTYMLIFSLTTIDYDSIAAKIKSNWTGKGLANLLLITAIIFGLLWIKNIFNFMISGELPIEIVDAGLLTSPVFVLDLAFLLPSAVISSLLLKRKIKPGYVLSLSVLITLILLAINIIAINIVIGARGLGDQTGLSIGFGIVTIIYIYFLADGFKQIKK